MCVCVSVCLSEFVFLCVAEDIPSQHFSMSGVRFSIHDETAHLSFGVMAASGHSTQTWRMILSVDKPRAQAERALHSISCKTQKSSLFHTNATFYPHSYRRVGTKTTFESLFWGTMHYSAENCYCIQHGSNALSFKRTKEAKAHSYYTDAF